MVKRVKWVIELGLNYAKFKKKCVKTTKVDSKIRTRDLQLMERRMSHRATLPIVIIKEITYKVFKIKL